MTKISFAGYIPCPRFGLDALWVELYQADIALYGLEGIIAPPPPGIMLFQSL